LKIHENIRRIRQWKNIPQKQISDETGIAQSVLSRIEQGADFRWSQLVKISTSLALSPEELICFNPKVVFNQVGKHSQGVVINQATDNQTELRMLREENTFLRDTLKALVNKKPINKK
jgi:predicted transcriptional regulator